MSRLFVYLGRFAAITLGFICAALVASAFVHVLLLGGPMARGSEPFHPDLSYPLAMTIPLFALMIGYWAFPPAIVVIVIAEMAAWRSWLFHACAGTAVAVLAGLIVAERNPFRHDMDVAAAFMAAGLAGGLAYWAVAGRNAGLWLDKRETTAPGPSGS